MTANAPEKLTGRQLEILGLIAKGCSNPDICKLLSISINTVKVHVAAILHILNVANRAEAAAAYQQLLAGDSDSELSGRAKAAHRSGCPAIAVLLFDQRAAIDDGFNVGLVEDLIARIASWRWFPVVAFASSGKFNLQQHSVAQIAAALKVGYLVAGAVRRSSSRARINVSLLKTSDGEAIWSEVFDCELRDVFTVQDEITRKIVARIAPELIASEARATQDTQISLDAWRHTARGLWHLAQRDRAHAAKARIALEAALEIDPEYGLAWYGRAQYHYQMVFEQWANDCERERQLFMRAVESCARIDPAAAGSHMLRALAHMIQGDAATAFAHLRESVSLDPSNSQALGLLGQLLGMQGAVEEGMAMLEDALRLNPLDPATSWIHVCTLAMGHFVLENYTEAEVLARRAIALKQDSAMPRAMLVACLESNGRHHDAKRAGAQLLEINPGFRIAPLVDLMSAATPNHVERFRGALAVAGLPG